MASSRVIYNYLGNSGLKISNICLGTAVFGNDPAEPLYARPTNLSEEESHAVMDGFAELGGNVFDTADVYQSGKSEEILGTWLAKRKREQFIVISKCRFYPIKDRTDPNNVGLSRKHIMDSIAGTLKRLGTDHVDIFMTHGWDSGTPVLETMSALDDIIHNGQAHYIGVSNVTGWQLQKMVDVAKQHGLTPPVCVQAQYNLACRGVELEVAEVCKSEGLALMPWSPLKGGFFGGKLKSDMSKPPEGTRMAWASEDYKLRQAGGNPTWQQHATPRNMQTLKKLEDISKQIDKSVPQISLRWLLQKPCVPSVVVASRTLDQLESNIGAATGWQLTSQQMEELDEVSDPGMDYPYDMVRKLNIARQK